jgi:hypothetical protein
MEVAVIFPKYAFNKPAWLRELRMGSLRELNNFETLAE